MERFDYARAADPAAAVHAASLAEAPKNETQWPTQYLAGGTNLIDYMKLDVLRPQRVIDINDLQDQHGAIEVAGDGLRLGALARMSDVADHPDVKRDYPVIAESLNLAASGQIRNMASVGGNVLQRTRCNYFRDVSYRACNKRDPGSGCAALEGVNRKHAVLGVSDKCIATYPGDFANALVALDARVNVLGHRGSRTMRFEDLHRAPGDTPEIETNLEPGDLILGFEVPAGPWTRRSLFLKIRDRESYEFALASAAVALAMDGGTVREARIALGGVATKPWRAHEAEAVLNGKPLDEAQARRAADAAFAGARTREQNAFKPELGRRTLVRALMQAQAMEV
ncbi:MAG TPA: xanthine dehydrogenase family protein subunit M [Caulobacteraceae bacterium]|jgi:xanthine dehydrogenase YagS FAD-binding subunit|nr:xanthine dehydrogenase family protein subunit M [Caulobacteraceae bacterium]